LPVVVLLVSEGVDSPHHQKLVRGFCLDSIFKREDGRRAGHARRTAGSTLYIPHPDGGLQQDQAALAAGPGQTSHLFLPAGRPCPFGIFHPERLWSTSTYDRTAEPLASPGWALTPTPCILMLSCRVAVSFSEVLSALRAQRWNRVVSRAGAWTSSLFSTPCRRACLDTMDYAALPPGVI